MQKRTIGLSLCVIVAASGIAGLSLGQPSGKAQPPAAQPKEADGANESAINFSEAPEPVRRAALKLTAEKNIHKVVKETDEGITTYEVEYTDGGAEATAVFSSAGEMLESERAVGQDELPAAALAAIKKAHPNTSLGTIHIVTTTLYEVEVVQNGKKQEVKVNAAGDIEDEDHVQNGNGKGNEKDEDDDDKAEMRGGHK